MILEKEFTTNIIEFDSAHKALSWFMFLDENNDNIPDIILLDLKMPQMDGWMFLEAFKNVRHQLKIKLQSIC